MSRRAELLHTVLVVVCVAAACRAAPPAIAFTTVPASGLGGPARLAAIAGRVTGARPGQRVVLYARSEIWWVQPLASEPFTAIKPDGTWSSSTHLGTEYAALLVDADYRPAPTVERLPDPGGQVAAIARVAGGGAAPPEPRTLQFSGYEWEVRQLPSDRGGANDYDPANAWTDADGFLHLRIARRGEDWTSAEVFLKRSLGYGTYAFDVRDVSQLEPAATFGMFTWDDLAAEQNHREIDIEISRWGDPANKNAQYVVQPYYLSTNVARFDAPAGPLTFSFRWQPGSVSFTTGRRGGVGKPLFARDFTAGVPTPGGESVRINLYTFRYAAAALQRDVEVVIEKFRYFP